MFATITNCWTLLFGVGLIMLGNGLQGTLLGVRAAIEGFGTTITGLVMAGYFLGLILGCVIVPRIVRKVGHIRTFGALASLASMSIAVQAVFVNPIAWWCMRIVTGFSYAGLYIVAESWLNEASHNNTRGKLLSVYMLISLGGLAGGQLLLNLSSPAGFELFILASMLISIAVIPILLSAAKAPRFDLIERISILQLYRISPLGVVGMTVNGMCYGAIFGMGAVYGTQSGMTVSQISLFMGILILGGVVFQYPLGWLSDAIGRRRVIICTSLAGGCVSLSAIFQVDMNPLNYLLIASIGGLSMPLYALCGVHTNDNLTPTQMVAASGTLILLSSTGAMLGSPITAFLMDAFGPSAFYGSLGAMMIFIGLFAMYRSLKIVNGNDTHGKRVVLSAEPLFAVSDPKVEMGMPVVDQAEWSKECLGQCRDLHSQSNQNDGLAR